jgi:serine protease
VIGGHSYTLTLTSHDDNYPGDPTYTLFDDVTIQ